MKVRWYDWLVYRLWHWRWQPILMNRPDLREFLISSLKAYDVLNVGDKIKVNISITKDE